MATATRVHAAILDRVRDEWAERIQCFLLVEKRTKPIRGTVYKGSIDRRSSKNATDGGAFGASSCTASGLSLAFGKTPIYYHECMFNVSYL
jgi:hypothetical protein